MRICPNGGVRRALAGACAALLAACSPGDDPDPTQGTLKVSLTDAPACGFDAVNVTVDRVRVHESAIATESDFGWSNVILNPARKIDLLTLTSGEPLSLGQTTLPAGQYQQLRLVLKPNASGSPGNSVVPTGGAEVALQMPSDIQAGVKLIHQFTVEGGKLVELVLDFDACRSVVQLANGDYELDPVVTVLPMDVAGRLTGTLGTAIFGADVTQASVSAQKDGRVVRATVPDSSGNYALGSIDARLAPFDLVITLPGAATAVVSAVPVTAGGTTTVPVITLAAGSVIGTVVGTVSPAAALPARVRAVQAAGSLPKVDVAGTNTSGAGDYLLSLPTAAVQLARYSAASLAFSSATTATTAGRYTIEGTDVNGGTKSATADIGTADAVVNFTFP